MAALPTPTATYRLQLGAAFTFADAAALVPYLHDLGVSHVYTSPWLKTRTGSPHGYDVVDHAAFNPEIGDRGSFDRLTDLLREHGMGLVADVVPNHMGVGGSDNAWWLDVLEHGAASPYAEWFDIDWMPVKEGLRHKLLLPVLGDHYGAVLERGELQLGFDRDDGSLSCWYHRHRFPLDPSTYPLVLRIGLDEPERDPGNEDLQALQRILSLCELLPARTETAAQRREERRHAQALVKEQLAALYRRAPAITVQIDGALQILNGDAADAASFDRLHALLERQAYRLAYWQVAADEINYRRFFDINDLAGLCAHHPEVFETTHRFLLDLVKDGRIHGLRIDHIDGLYDPAGYLRRLRDALRQALDVQHGDALPCWVVVEKILAVHERLPADWPVHGTTGYDFLNAVNGLFVDSAGERAMTRIYSRHGGGHAGLADIVHRCRELVIRTQLSSELTMLANRLDDIAQSHRHTRDFTLNGLREALVEVVAAFPVYRTYVGEEGASDEDRRHVDWAVSRARRLSSAADPDIFGFLRAALLAEPAGERAALRERLLHWARQCQQYTTPVAAKAVEDTAFYRYHRLIALNEVGGDPNRFGVPPTAFHRTNQELLRDWPLAMTTTSTHDTKRSEDVRARLDVLSEIPGEWRARLARWGRIHRSRVRLIDGLQAPSANDRHLFYQTLLGVWPLADPGEDGLAKLAERIEAYMIKALREAKEYSSWIHPDADYERAMCDFVQAVFSPAARGLFLRDFLPFQQRVARYGLYNGLSQTLLKLVSPGVPDLYQGNEVWDFSLVDPDNRRPVDYAAHRAVLEEVAAISSSDDRAVAVRALVDTLEDGRAKLYLTREALRLRRERPALFRQGEYLPLAIQGTRAEHAVAFARRHEGDCVFAAAPRLCIRLTADPAIPPLGESVWEDTRIETPVPGTWRNLLTNERLTADEHEGTATLSAAQVFGIFPAALLVLEG